MRGGCEIRRARPLLGTLVEISAWGSEPAALRRAVDRAFNAIEVLQARLSAHDPASEVSRLNRDGHLGPVRVGRDLRRVLRAAARLSRLSEGAFDVTAAAGGASYRDVRLLPRSRVRYARALRIDLGGIAKGYCVDRAVAQLERCGVAGGLVNAGGDLRAFGARAFALQLRHPGDPRQLVDFGTIRDAALSTSASYATGRERCAGALRDGRSGAPLRPGVSVSVRASRALTADALTKVVAALGPRAAPLLARCRAHAWVMEAPCPAAE
ncbi:MAG TPA: FAD:protein FMN transferase [Burkholderiales bacterium]|nr:FAD:protein FMN transferase [Burkholderiales bacterium]